MHNAEARIVWKHFPGRVLEYEAWFEYDGYQTFLHGTRNKDEFFAWYEALAVVKQPAPNVILEER